MSTHTREGVNGQWCLNLEWSFNVQGEGAVHNSNSSKFHVNQIDTILTTQLITSFTNCPKWQHKCVHAIFSYSRKYENWNYHLGRRDATGCWINISPHPLTIVAFKTVKVWVDAHQRRTYEDVTRVLLWFTIQMEQINKGSRVINIENSDNAGMNDALLVFSLHRVTVVRCCSLCLVVNQWTGI
jgi:hypothetical protein